ncbi:MAG: response regulator [Rhodomicrobium sp.]|nr:response regulator [Rhodomicrobium sp.]
MLNIQENESQELAIIQKRVLVAEDSPVTQDLLKLILNQRGHTVDIAHDGQQALIALRQNAYDVALIDFHLPELDGLQVAKSYRSERNGGAQARLIAITADIEGLLSHSENCENFDQIIPKPLDIFDICNVIEQTASRSAAAAGESPDLAQGGELPEPGTFPKQISGNPAARPRPADPSWALGLEWLRWPEDFHSKRFAAYSAKAFNDLDAIDGIIVQEAADIAGLAPIWDHRPLHLFPIIDLNGRLGPQADLNGSSDIHTVRDSVRQLVQSFHQRRAQLHRDLLTSSALGDKLLSRLYVQNSPLSASYDAGHRSLTRYNVPLDAADVAREAEALRSQGFLSRDFFERFHVCYRCSSARLHAREECPQCHSSNLREEQYVHHYKCAYQGVESDFRRGDRLVCPKCRQELSHFSVDYDKPGSMIVCGRCGHAGSEPAVGFVCLDCTARMDADAAAVKDVYSYSLTKEGEAFAQVGYALAGADSARSGFRICPWSSSSLSTPLPRLITSSNRHSPPSACFTRTSARSSARRGCVSSLKPATCFWKLCAARSAAARRSSGAMPMISVCSKT